MKYLAIGLTKLMYGTWIFALQSAAGSWNDCQFWATKDGLNIEVAPQKTMICRKGFKCEEASLSCCDSRCRKNGVDCSGASFVRWNSSVIGRVKGVMYIVEVVMIKEVFNLVRVYYVIKITHENNLFLRLDASRQELTEVVEKECSWAFVIILGEKISVLLCV